MGGNGARSRNSGYLGGIGGFGGGSSGFGGGGGGGGAGGGGGGGSGGGVGGGGTGAGGGAPGAGGGGGAAQAGTGTGVGGSLGTTNMPNVTMGMDPNLPGFIAFQNNTINADMHHASVNFDTNKWSSLTPEQRAAIVGYTDYAYRDVNGYLRFGIPGTTQYVDQYGHTKDIAGKSYNYNGVNINYLDISKQAPEGIKAMGGLQEDCIAWRGANLSVTASMFGVDVSYMSDASYLQSRLGSVLTDKGITSSGVDEAMGWPSDVKMKIYAHQGANAFYVDPVSANSGEMELLWASGSQFIFHSFKTDSQGRICEMVIESI